MSVSKRFAPTVRRLRKAREDGDIAKSHEITGACSQITTLVFLAFFGQEMVNRVVVLAEKTFALDGDFQSNNMLLYGGETGNVLVGVVSPLFLTVFLAAGLAEVVQVGFKFSLKLTAFNFSRLSIFQGLKRVLGFREGSDEGNFPLGLVAEISKVVTCLAVLAGCATGAVVSFRADILWADYSAVGEVIEGGSYVIARILAATLFAYLVIAVIDVTAAKQRRLRRLRMSIEELRQELRESEGNAEVRAQRRSLCREIAQQGLLDGIRRAKILVVGGKQR